MKWENKERKKQSTTAVAAAGQWTMGLGGYWGEWKWMDRGKNICRGRMNGLGEKRTDKMDWMNALLRHTAPRTKFP
jgi:hypothetical protein